MLSKVIDRLRIFKDLWPLNLTLRQELNDLKHISEKKNTCVIDPNPYSLCCLFLGCACTTSPMTSVWQDGKIGHVATNLVSVILPEWWSSEKQDKERDCDIAFPAQSSVSHFTRQQKRSLAVHPSQNLGSLCSSMITKRRVNWPFCLRQVAEWHVWFILCTSLCLDAERRGLCVRHLWTEELHRVDIKYPNCGLMLGIKAGLNSSHIMMRKTERKTCS